ncbi:hypothetical protein [Dictyobacter kobayashii]|uniref:Uncharacterized protein n=1 Tax=Dictyobacter kobayashii TaxID=2014872 RepID=A0A402AUC5_9CHLR|nr:hypothetical protein [Dictyobacter kobayashii]GCE22746.1 hypothetical protein KDK_65460 [Dictyobacter kobayashii]
MHQPQHKLKNVAHFCAHNNCAHLSHLYTLGLPLIFLLLAGIFLLKAAVQAHPKERRKSLKYSGLTFLLALLSLSQQWFWILPGLALYKLLPLVTGLLSKNVARNGSTSQAAPASRPASYSLKGSKTAEEGEAALHYQYLSSYYSYDEQPQALYPQAIPPR